MIRGANLSTQASLPVPVRGRSPTGRSNRHRGAAPLQTTRADPAETEAAAVNADLVGPFNV